MLKVKKSFFVVLFALFFANSFIQGQDWLPGCIVKNDGDTINGFIKNESIHDRSKFCTFKTTENDKPQKFLPNDISSYKYKDGAFFVSKNIAEEGKEPQFLFLEYMIHGKINMYHYLADDDYYYAEKDGKMFELKSTNIVSETFGNETILGERKEYIGLLSALMSDANINKDIQNTDLEPKSLIKIAEEYHNKVCTDEKCIVYEKQIKPLHVAISLQGGLASNEFQMGDGLTVSDYNYSQLIGCRAEFQNVFVWVENITFSIDANLQYFSKYNLKGGEPSTEIAYNGPDITYNDKNYHLTNYYVYEDEKKVLLKADTSVLGVNLKTWALMVPMTVNYTFLKTKFKPYINLGVVNMFLLSSNKKFVYTISDYYYNRSLPLYSLGFVGRAGCKYQFKNNKAVYLEFNFQYLKSMLDHPIADLHTKLFSLNVGYTL